MSKNLHPATNSPSTHTEDRRNARFCVFEPAGAAGGFAECTLETRFDVDRATSMDDGETLFSPSGAAC
ncbi:MAG: hypothetical protein K0U78_02550 [Actinomycetia bacterium]|nr:hypothetical protein [Actinomycetes bacterium]